MEDEFYLPIEYLENKTELDEDIIDDLELLETKTQDVSKCLYDYVFEPKTMAGMVVKKKWGKYYTSDTRFLKQSQKLYEDVNIDLVINNDEETKIVELLEDIKTEDNFEERYIYINNIWLSDKFNNNEQLMFMYSLLLILSPIATLISPIMILILPFFILKILNKDISVSEYIIVIKQLLRKMPLGRLLDINLKNMNSTLYALFSAGMYVFQLYQNTKTCINLKDKTYEILDKLESVKVYLCKSVKRMQDFILTSQTYKSYEHFNNVLIERIGSIENYLSELDVVSRNTIYILKNIGCIRCKFYDLYKNEKRKKILEYAFEFNGYLDNINELQKNMKTVLGKTKYVKTYTKIAKIFYPAIEGDKIQNNVSLKKNQIITGVNASGKTTLIKSILFSVLLSQQIGFGFFESSSLRVYDRLHCYLNIPDTSGRDSLFQAEARRCKTIIDVINKEYNKRHLCIFDELYSGTNPHEAVLAGYSYIKYLCKRKQVGFLLTTHYLDMCDKLEKDNKTTIENFHMSSYYKNDELIFTYKKVKGITEIKGGIEILKKLNYPLEILNDAKKYV